MIHAAITPHLIHPPLYRNGDHFGNPYLGTVSNHASHGEFNPINIRAVAFMTQKTLWIRRQKKL